MNPSPRAVWMLPAIVTVLAVADGILHLALDAILFRGNFFGPLGPPPGAPAGPRPGPPVPLPLPLNQMFVLNLVGYVVLVALLWYAIRSARAWRVRVDALLAVYTAVVLLAWVEFGAPNPMGLGYLSKIVEVVLILALLADIWLLSRRRPVPSMAT